MGLKELMLDVDGIFPVLEGGEVIFVITADVTVELTGKETGSEQVIGSDVNRDVCITVVLLAKLELGTDELLVGVVVI